MLEYTQYYGASTINLNFWLSWFFDMVSEVKLIRGHGFESQPLHPSFKVKYSVPMHIHISNPMGSHVRGRVRVHNIF